MAFAMSLPRTKRVKYYNPDGSEVFEEEDRWALVRAVHSSKEEAGKDEEEQEPKASARAPTQPLEALEKLHMARGEVTMMLDLIEMLEAQQFMGISNVPPQEQAAPVAARSRQICLQAKARQLQAAGEQLKRGAAALRAHLKLEDRYFGEVAELASDWKVTPAPEFNFSSAAAPYRAELGVAREDQPPETATTLDLGRNADGSLQVVSPAGERVTGVAAAAAVLRGCQHEILWEGLERALQAEAQASGASAAAQKLVAEVLHAGRFSRHPDLLELGALLMKDFLTLSTADRFSGESPKLLPAVNTWLRHRWFSSHLWRSLHAQAAEMRSASHEVQLEPLHVPGPARSAIRVQLAKQSVLLIVRGDSLEIRGAPPPLGQTWTAGVAGLSTRPSETGSLLKQLLERSGPSGLK